MRRGSLLIGVVVVLACATPAHAADPLRAQQWGMTMVHADQAHATATGAGATVAVVDTGAYFAHPDLQGRLIAGRDFVQNDDDPQDGEGHGTHVAGIVAANTGNGVGVESVAPGAKVLVVRVLGDDGSGSTDDVIAGIDWAVAHGADVLNLSLGPDPPILGNDPNFDAAIDRALDRGVIVVAAAGNSGLPVCEQPSGSGRLLCVGAVDRNESKAFYSSFGDGLGISAPGGAAFGPITDDILSTYARTSAYEPSLGPYEYLAGTSQATPHVAGVAALLVSLGVRGQAAVQRILQTARDVGMPGPDPIYGAGIVDASAAVAGIARPGAGGGGSGGAGGATTGASGSAARISLARVQRIRSVLRRGIVVRCTAAGAGRCKVRAYVSPRRIASGSRALQAGRLAVVHVAALLVSLGVRGQAAVQRILQTARDVGMPGPDPVYGAGIVDASAAVAGIARPGAGGGGSGGAGGATTGASGSAARISLARVQRIRGVLRRGIVVRCTAAGAGRCKVRAYVSPRRIASGSRALQAGRLAVVHARLTARGRALLLADLRRRHPRTLRATVYVALPGARTQKRAVLLKP